MSEAITIFVCKSPADCAKAQAFLTARGFPDANITIEQADTITYDAKTFDDPAGTTDIMTGYVVKGVK